MLAVSALSEVQSCALIAVEILCRLCRHLKSNADVSIENLGTGIVAASLIDDLMQLIDPDHKMFNCSRPFDLQLVSLAVRNHGISTHNI